MKSSKQTPTTTATATTEPSSEHKSLRKQLSKTNLAALLSGKSGSSTGAGSGKRKVAKEDSEAIEMQSQKAPGRANEETSTKDTIAAVKLEIEQNRLGGNNQTAQPVLATTTIIHPIRAVFKKQQTYPGAISPSISGQDRFFPANEQQNAATTTGSAGIAAARRATIILNKVKQPLKDLGSNFNTTNSPSNSHSAETTSVSSKQTGTKIASGSNTSGKSRPQATTLTPSYATPSTTASATHSTATGGHPANHLISSAQVPGFLGPKSSPSDRTMNSSIDITSLSYIPGAKEYHYLGNLSLSFVRETNSVRENGGLNGFIHCFLMEVYAIVRAHVSALGGNAFLSCRLQQSCIFYHSNKNQAQCLISVAGDAVQVTL